MKSVAQLKRDTVSDIFSLLRNDPTLNEYSHGIERRLDKFLKNYQAIQRKRQERWSDLARHGRAINVMRDVMQT